MLGYWEARETDRSQQLLGRSWSRRQTYSMRLIRKPSQQSGRDRMRKNMRPRMAMMSRAEKRLKGNA